MSQSKKDRDLGINRSIARRDFLNGVGVVRSERRWLPRVRFLAKMLNAADAQYAPEQQPATTRRGQEAGCAAATMAPGKRPTPRATAKSGTTPQKTTKPTTWIIVAEAQAAWRTAYFYRQQAGDKARILILDNHDDFGGHAKRNEFTSSGKKLIGWVWRDAARLPATGNLYSAQAKAVIRRAGHRSESASKPSTAGRFILQERGMGQAVFFDKETVGADRLVRGWQTAIMQSPTADFLASALPEAAKKDLIPVWAQKKWTISPGWTQPRRKPISQKPAIKTTCSKT